MKDTKGEEFFDKTLFTVLNDQFEMTTQESQRTDKSIHPRDLDLFCRDEHF